MSQEGTRSGQDDRPRWADRSSVGTTGERLAAEYLKRSGYRLVASNFKVPVGRNSKGVQVTGEIDLIALDGETLCFIEVKSRTSETFAPAISAVDLRKQRQITRTARVYRRVFGITDIAFRFDVVTVVSGDEPKVEHTKNYWTEAKFRKQRWHNEFA